MNIRIFSSGGNFLSEHTLLILAWWGCKIYHGFVTNDVVRNRYVPLRDQTLGIELNKDNGKRFVKFLLDKGYNELEVMYYI